MALVRIRYTPYVLTGRGSGVKIAASKSDPLGLASKLGPAAMSRRIHKMMDKLGKLLGIYVKLQFDTGGLAMHKIAPQLGIAGGSDEPWKALKQTTLFARHRSHGYYGVFGSGEDPRVWTGRGKVVHTQAISVGTTRVSINLRDPISALNEATRPVFVLSEVARLTRALAERYFRHLTTGKALVHGGPFDLTVGEAAPFDLGDKFKTSDPLSGAAALGRRLKL